MREKIQERGRVDEGYFSLIFKITLIMSYDAKELVCLKNEINNGIPSTLPWQHALRQTYRL